jgi:hypothetical protein
VLLTPAKEAAYLAHRHCGLRLDGAGSVLHAPLKAAAGAAAAAAAVAKQSSRVVFCLWDSNGSGAAGGAEQQVLLRVPVPLPYRIPPQRFDPPAPNHSGPPGPGPPVIDMSAPYGLSRRIPFIPAGSLGAQLARLFRKVAELEAAAPIDLAALKRAAYGAARLLLDEVLEPWLGVEGEVRRGLEERAVLLDDELAALPPDDEDARGDFCGGFGAAGDEMGVEEAMMQAALAESLRGHQGGLYGGSGFGHAQGDTVDLTAGGDPADVVDLTGDD